MTQFGARASHVPQPALATFMESGEFAIHLRRMRRTYAKRQKHLISALADSANLLDLTPDPSGMHMCVSMLPKLRGQTTDAEVADLARSKGVQVRSLSSHCVSVKLKQVLTRLSKGDR